MRTDIIRKKDMFCDEIAFSTICNRFDIPYQLLFSHTWGFDYNGDDSCIGNNIKINEWNLLKIMKQFGIEEILDKDIYNVVPNLRNHLQQGEMSIIGIDMKKYNEIKGTSYVGKYSPYLIYDYEDDFVGYDLHYTHETINLSETLIKKTCSSMRFYRLDKKNEPFVFKYNLGEIHDVLIPHRPNFERIKQLAVLFDNGAVDLKYETKDLLEGDNPIYAPLINKIETLARGRNLFSMYLEYLNSVISEIELEELTEKMTYWAGKWNLIKVILIKSFFKSNYEQDVMKKISLILFDISKGEKELYEQLISVSVTNKVFGKYSMNKNTKLTKYQTDIIKINLIKNYNNAGIKIAGLSKKADMTGLGAYIEFDEEQLLNATLESRDAFELCKNAKQLYDNVLCMGQEIKIPVGRYNSLNILGCSDYGNFSDYLMVCYEDGIEKVMINFSSWINKEPLFGEKVYCTGSLKEVKSYLNKSEGTLFSQSLRLKNKQVQAIILPNCPTMHIFSIYLS